MSQENAKWQAVIGLEVHVQLNTESKAFSPSAVKFGSPPNSLVDPTVAGLPGALPVFNRAGLELAILLGTALGCQIRRDSQFARKHYFYPDSPKGYQISQFDAPICEGGEVRVLLDGEIRSFALTRIHLEDDAGKSSHMAAGHSLVDLNRAGVCLCEIVSEPVLRSAKEAAAYMRALRQMVRYLGVSEGDMEKGQLRCDANVSVRPVGQEKFGTRTELKNINSFKFVEKAISYEIARHIHRLEAGESIVQETRLWDSEAGVSRSMRSKEEAMDYRYFPDPDLPPLILGQAEIDSITENMPELPIEAFSRLQSLGLSPESAAQLSAERPLLTYFDDCRASLYTRLKLALESQDKSARKATKLCANWIQSELWAEWNRCGESAEQSRLSPESLSELLALISEDAISAKIAKSVLGKMYEDGSSAAEIVEREGLRQVNDTGALESIIDELLTANDSQVQKYKEGNKKMLAFFVGQVMKATKGQANPKMVNQLLQSKLS